MLVGLRNATATFQAQINSIFGYFTDNLQVIFSNDILILSDTKEYHLRYLETELTKVRRHELYVGSRNFELMR